MPTNANSTANGDLNSTGEPNDQSTATRQTAREPALMGRRGNSVNAERDLSIDTVLRADAADGRQQGSSPLPGTAL